MKNKETATENLIKTIEKNVNHMKRLNDDMDTIKDKNMLASQKETYGFLNRRSKV